MLAPQIVNAKLHVNAFDLALIIRSSYQLLLLQLLPLFLVKLGEQEGVLDVSLQP